ncbi:PAS domain S-box protein [Rufibacter glacialis]|uniref:Oxygen sensor histidine kinase NreB n=1 Tax=Rufibacter glacialis TaxID=1259555 RepID=A0A5M8Q6V0_9BACT|nr:PAS domain S-box protein [Rufibacter glacialis]KAA6430791.1 PAS domain S-box protein [Rufibacter glacialis]GGK86756.1 hypothetical protein GCM10011405_38150 [Rufibacter glacialis]
MNEEKREPIGMAHDFSLLRQEAEKLQKPISATEVGTMTPHEVSRLIQELQIHQVELEMQNHQMQLVTQELEAARAKYLDLYQHSPFGYVTLDEHGVVEEANKKGLELLGTSREHLIARRFSQFIHQDSLDAFYGFFRKVLLSDQTKTVELQILSNNGGVFYAQLEGLLLRRQNDTDQCRIAFLDVTERKTAHIELANKEALLSAIINSSLNAVQVFKANRDRQGHIIDFEWILLNRTAELFLDFTLPQLRRHRLNEILPSFLTEGHFFTFVNVVENGHPATFTAHLKRNDWEHWLNCVAVKLEDGFVLTFEDVTQPRQANEKLQESQLLVKKMAEAMPDFLYVEDLQQGRNLYNNRDFLAFLGYKPADIKGHPRELLDTLYHPQDAHLLLDRAARFAEKEDGELLEYQVRIKAKNGTWRNILFRETVFKRGASGVPVQLVGMAQDITKKLQSENELRQLHETMSAILDNLPVTLWRIGTDGHVLESKGAGLRALGLKEDQMVGQSFATVHQALDRQIRQALAGNQINTLAEFEVEGRKVHKQVYLFQDTGTGEAIGFCLDVTEQKQAEENARYQTMLLDQLLENLPLVLAVLDLQGTYLDIRGNGLRKLGIQDGQLRGESIFKVFPQLEGNIRDVLAGQVKSFPAAFPHQGRQLHFQNYGFLDQDKKRGIAFGIDITDLKEAQEEMARAKEFSENLLENNVNGIFALDLHLQITAWNRAVAKCTSLERAQVLGKPIHALTPAKSKTRLGQYLKRVLLGEEVTLTSLPFLPEGRYFEIQLTPIYGTDREITGVLGMVRDTTAQRRRHREETKIKLAQQKDVMDVIITTQNEERKRIAEALHNSLAQLLYAAKLNMEEIQTEVTHEEKLEKVLVPIRRVSRFLEEAIKETRTLAHELIPRVLVDFGLKSALKDLATRLSTNTFSVQCVVTGFDQPKNYEFETYLFRFVQELLNNVMKHAEATEALVQVVDKGKTVRVRVQDNGKGMPKNWASKAANKGMGLMTLRNRAKLLQGDMEIDSTPGEGTTITIEIPH